MNVPLPSQIKHASKPAKPYTPHSTETVENVSSPSAKETTASESRTSPRKMSYGKRPEHLTDRPFKNNDALAALRDKLSEGPKGRVSNKKQPRRVQRP